MKNNKIQSTPRSEAEFALWKYLSDEHGLALLETEIGDIIQLCRAIIATEQPDPWKDAPESLVSACAKATEKLEQLKNEPF